MRPSGSSTLLAAPRPLAWTEDSSPAVRECTCVIQPFFYSSSSSHLTGLVRPLSARRVTSCNFMMRHPSFLALLSSRFRDLHKTCESRKRNDSGQVKPTHGHTSYLSDPLVFTRPCSASVHHGHELPGNGIALPPV
jgi:hypothetical protein